MACTTTAALTRDMIRKIPYRIPAWRRDRAQVPNNSRGLPKNDRSLFGIALHSQRQNSSRRNRHNLLVPAFLANQFGFVLALDRGRSDWWSPCQVPRFGLTTPLTTKFNAKMIHFHWSHSFRVV